MKSPCRLSSVLTVPVKVYKNKRDSSVKGESKDKNRTESKVLLRISPLRVNLSEVME